jgi:hypothetical protein
VAQKYRLIALSYIDMPAVAQVCTAARGDPLCAEKFRQKRVFGEDTTALISDTSADSIVNRTTKLLHYLAATDASGGWSQYLHNGLPKWERIAVAGQSQGGGMAAFVAKKFRVPRVILFSGGWDTAGRADSVASWYSQRSATPAELWYGTYHVDEPKAAALAVTYQALQIPSAHVFALSQPVPPGKKAHPQGVSNPVYRPQWILLLGEGTGP